MTEQERKELIEEMKRDKEGGSGKANFWNIPSKEEGTFKIRFLPPMKKLGEKTFYFKHKVHWINGRPYECLDQTTVDKDGKVHEAEKCPICSFVNKLYKTANKGDDDWNLAGRIRAKERNVSRIVVRGSDDETTPKFYEYGPTIFNMLFHIITESEFGMIIDPKDGRDFNLVKTGTGRDTKYDTSIPSLEKSPIFKDPEKLKELFEKASNMKYNDNIEFLTKEEMKSVLEEYLGGDDEIEETHVPKKEVKKETYMSKSEPETYTEPTENETEDEEEDDIDAILGEFTN